MTSLDTNIQTVKKECQEIEKQLCEQELPAKSITELSEKFTKCFNALSLLSQIKSAVKSDIITVESKIVTMQ